MCNSFQNKDATCDICNCYTDERSLEMTEVTENDTLFLCQSCVHRYDDEEIYEIVQEMKHDAMVDRQVDDYLLTKTEKE